MSGSHSSSDDSSDSRKRPREKDIDLDTSPKRPNCEDNVQLKILVPSIAAGAVIGKSGEAIGRIQKDTNTKVKISKQDEFYPGFMPLRSLVCNHGVTIYESPYQVPKLLA
ncbi:RNA-binding protein [Schistosoma japonicum]|uniref:RNA-binding protein n=1 Tax=Schistosoma japonicum TaxID=6182 RepID=A0A4Z2CY85_SCHJA|nr:RNA-binding protein [Schistosoma japonicum]